MSYLEQSTRYLGYDRRLTNGLYRFYRDSDLLDSRFGARYIGEMDRMFDTYRELLPELTDWLTLQVSQDPRRHRLRLSPGHSREGPRRTARTCCRRAPCRISASTPRARRTSHCSCACARTRCPRCASTPQLMLDELVKVIPSFLRRLDVPERGRRVDRRTLPTLERHARAPGEDDDDDAEVDEGVRLVAFDPEGESRVLEAIVFANSTARTTTPRDAWRP